MQELEIILREQATLAYNKVTWRRTIEIRVTLTNNGERKEQLSAIRA